MSVPTFANAPESLGHATTDFVPTALEREVRRIYARSPLYPQRFPLHPEPLQWSCFREIPALSKQEIIERGHQAFFVDYGEVERGFQTKRFEYESTGGTTQAPMTVIMEEGWWNAQTERAYLASPILREFVGRPHRKCVLAPVGCSSNLCPYEDHPFPHRYFDGVVYLNLSSDPFAFPEREWDRIVLELQATRPEILEGEPVYLSLLARAAKKRGVRIPSLRAVILTYGKASLQHGARIAEVFPVPQVDLYGSTEAGYLFVGEAFKDNSQVIDANAFVELVPWRHWQSSPRRQDHLGHEAHAGANGSAAGRANGASVAQRGTSGIFQIYVTTRDREAMPLLRYHTGDIVQKLPHGFRLLGRESNLHFRANGSLVSPADIDAALPAGFACWHYMLVQTGETRWDFHYVADHAPAHRELETPLAAMLGDGARVNAFRRRVIAPAASGKFSLLKVLPATKPA
ncbi:MAG: CoF synthetase [Opitutaceae bacterium]|nr:CoF synthetase [Opitutaceae bacterium]